jgi:hypothetical protein
MNKSKLVYLMIFLTAIFSGLSVFYYLNKTVSAEPSLLPSTKPCWFKAYDDPSISFDEIKARQDREMYGYSVDVPIETAVKKFNEEMRCYPHFNEFPEITEDEVIASLIDFDSLNNEPNYSEVRREERRKIINDRILPKGSLLQFDSGGCRYVNYSVRDLCAKGLRITLIFNLDKKEDVKIPSNLEDIFVVRKTFIKVQPRQH